MSGTLRGDQIIFDCCWPNQIAIKTLSSSAMMSGSKDSRGGTNIKRTLHEVVFK